MPDTLDSELNDAMLTGGQTPADVQAALEAELTAELDRPKPRKPKPRPAPEPPESPTLKVSPRMSVDVEYVRSDSTKMLNARIDEHLMTHLNLVAAVNKARKTGMPTVRAIIEQSLVEWFDRNAPLPGREAA